jgi:hypothetical protein
MFYIIGYRKKKPAGMSVTSSDKSVGIVSDISGVSKNDPNALNISAASTSSDTIIEEVNTGRESKGSTKKAVQKKRKRKRNCSPDVLLYITSNQKILNALDLLFHVVL